MATIFNFLKLLPQSKYEYKNIFLYKNVPFTSSPRIWDNKLPTLLTRHGT